MGRLPQWKTEPSKKEKQKEEDRKIEKEKLISELKKNPLEHKKIYSLEAEEVDEDQKWLVKLGYSLWEDESSSKSSLDQKRITYLYSATLTLSMKDRSLSTKHLMINSKNNKAAFMKNVVKGNQRENQENLEESLIKKIDFHNKIDLIDLTSGITGVASTVSEAKIECSEESKDNFLFYFLKRYCSLGHKSIVFVNTISTIRRMISLLRMLGFSVCGIHGQMHQKQRLKNLQKFIKEEKKGYVLLATDVAARGNLYYFIFIFFIYLFFIFILYVYFTIIILFIIFTNIIYFIYLFLLILFIYFLFIFYLFYYYYLFFIFIFIKNYFIFTYFFFIFI